MDEIEEFRVRWETEALENFFVSESGLGAQLSSVFPPRGTFRKVCAICHAW